MKVTPAIVMSVMASRYFNLRWLNTVFDTSVSFTFSSKTLHPTSKQVNNTNVNFLIIKLTYVPLPWQHD